MEEVVITKLNSDDVNSFITLIKEAFEIDVDSKNIQESLLDSNKIYVVAKDKNNREIVGNILVDIDFDAIRNVKKFYLGYVCVRESYKSRGIGTRLLKEVENLANKMNVSTIWFTSSFDKCAAHNLYKKNNYQIRDTAVFIKNLNN